jgi:dTDP-4-dehydrorhamnose 3,5-epimerase
MKVEKTDLEGVVIIKPDEFKDSRGYFFESFNEKKYWEHRIPNIFVQDNISKSIKGTRLALPGWCFCTGKIM